MLHHCCICLYPDTFSPAHVSALVSLVAVAQKSLPTISAAKNAVSLARSKDLVLTHRYDTSIGESFWSLLLFFLFFSFLPWPLGIKVLGEVSPGSTFIRSSIQPALYPLLLLTLLLLFTAGISNL